MFKDLRRRWESSPDISTAREALYALPAATQSQQLQVQRDRMCSYAKNCCMGLHGLSAFMVAHHAAHTKEVLHALPAATQSQQLQVHSDRVRSCTDSCCRALRGLFALVGRVTGPCC